MKASDWIKVEDKLPDVSEKVLVATKNGNYIVTSMYIPKDSYSKILGDKEWRGNSSVKDSITHWMPIISPKED